MAELGGLLAESDDGLGFAEKAFSGWIEAIESRRIHDDDGRRV